MGLLPRHCLPRSQEVACLVVQWVVESKKKLQTAVTMRPHLLTSSDSALSAGPSSKVQLRPIFFFQRGRPFCRRPAGSHSFPSSTFRPENGSRPGNKVAAHRSLTRDKNDKRRCQSNRTSILLKRRPVEWLSAWATCSTAVSICI